MVVQQIEKETSNIAEKVHQKKLAWEDLKIAIAESSLSD